MQTHNIAFTGHRTYTDKPQNVHAALLRLSHTLDRLLANGDQVILHTGGATGFDSLAMRTLRHFGHHVLHIPFTYQSVALMAKTTEMPDDWELCKTCGPVAWDGDKQRFQRRNMHMVDLSDALYAYYNGSPGGTRNCVEYAKTVHKPTINIMTGEILE